MVEIGAEFVAEVIAEIGILIKSPISLFAKTIAELVSAIFVPIISITLLCLSPRGDAEESFLLPALCE